MKKKPEKTEKTSSDYLENELESLRAMLRRLFKNSRSEPDEKSVYEKKQKKDTPADEGKKGIQKANWRLAAAGHE